MRILISGKSRAGKDTVASMLQKSLGYKIAPFAGPLKRIIATTFQITENELNTMKNNNTNLVQVGDKQMTMRSILQRFGTDACQTEFGSSFWAEMWYKQGDNIIAPDWRFIHEHRDDTVTIRVENPSVISTSTHRSETELDNFKCDYVINNNGSLADLKYKVNGVVLSLLPR